MSLALDIASWVLLSLGAVFCIISGIGVLRLHSLQRLLVRRRRVLVRLQLVLQSLLVPTLCFLDR